MSKILKVIVRNRLDFAKIEAVRGKERELYVPLTIQKLPSYTKIRYRAFNFNNDNRNEILPLIFTHVKN